MLECDVGEFKCDGSKHWYVYEEKNPCINRVDVCDGVLHCTDGSDERQPVCSKISENYNSSDEYYYHKPFERLATGS